MRCPIIPALNDWDEHFDAIAALANTLSSISEINLEPYHPLGTGKTRMPDMEYALKELSFPDVKEVEKWLEYISSKTSVPVKKA